MTTLKELQERLPDFAKDTKLNVSQVLNADYSEGLNPRQIYGTALACAYALENEWLSQALLLEGKDVLSDQDVIAAKAAASLMAMNNIYYRFLHLNEDPELNKRPARLRMNFMANPGVEKIDFEIYSLAVSALAGCGMCIKSHVKTIKSHGLKDDAIQSTARIAAVMNAFATSLTLS